MFASTKIVSLALGCPYSHVGQLPFKVFMFAFSHVMKKAIDSLSVRILHKALCFTVPGRQRAEVRT